MSDAKVSPNLASLRFEPLGFWNIYFLFKLGLYFFDSIQLHVLENLAFLAFLMIPFGTGAWRKAKAVIAVIAAILLLHYDSYLPPLSRLLDSADMVAGFSFAYMIELLGRFISWQAIALLFVLVVTFLYLNSWVRFTGVNILALLFITLTGGNSSTGPVAATFESTPSTKNPMQNNQLTRTTTTQAAPATDSPDGALAAFYASQSAQVTQFPSKFNGADFDVVILNVCSLGWDDLAYSGKQNHRFMQQFDVLFENFNSATSYSGPAAIRLFNASCGQKSHNDLYSGRPQQCNLFGQLAKLGFETDFAMNHNGFFDDFLGLVKSKGGINTPLQSLDNIKVAQRSFDGSPIYSDAHVLDKWLRDRVQTGSSRHALYFNTISLHDGNVLVGKGKSSNSLESYGTRAEILFNDLGRFFEKLQSSGKNYMVVMVPEHGAALKGDKKQFSGMRDIPSPSVVNIPVGVKFIGPRLQKTGAGVRVSEPSSYLAISELVSRTITANPFTNKQVNVQNLIAGLPKSELVAENEGTKLIMFAGAPYIQIDGGSWQKYPGY
jgi:cellulose synthase operon protein YhjU